MNSKVIISDNFDFTVINKTIEPIQAILLYLYQN